MALFSLVLVALLTRLGAALYFDSSPKEPGEDGMLDNIDSLFFLINILKNNAQTAVLMWARSIFSSVEEYTSDARREGGKPPFISSAVLRSALLPLCRRL